MFGSFNQTERIMKKLKKWEFHSYVYIRYQLTKYIIIYYNTRIISVYICSLMYTLIFKKWKKKSPPRGRISKKNY